MRRTNTSGKEEKEMSKIDIDNINKEWARALEEKGIYSYMIYKPFDDYWNQKTKIMVCNLETYGYDDCGIIEVNINQLKDWMKATNITRTTRNTSVFIYALQKALSNQKLTQQEIRKTYYQFDDLVKAMNRICYMNFRKESNPNVSQDVNNIIAEVKENKDILIRFILACEPNIILIGGHLGVNSFNTIFEPEKRLFYDSETEYEGIRIISTKHLSRISYSYIENKIKTIIEKGKNA